MKYFSQIWKMKKTCVVNLPSQPVRGAVDDRCVRNWRILLEFISLDSLNMDMVCISLQHILPFSGVWWNDRNRLWHQVQIVKCVQRTILSLWGAARDKLVALISHEMVKQFMPHLKLARQNQSINQLFMKDLLMVIYAINYHKKSLSLQLETFVNSNMVRYGEFRKDTLSRYWSRADLGRAAQHDCVY